MNQSKKTGLLLDPRMLDYDFGEGHVMNAHRIFPAFSLFEDTYVMEGQVERIQTSTYDSKYLHLAHSEEYITKFSELSKLGTGDAPEFGLGTPDCPIWEGMAEVSEFVVNSTMSIAKEIQKGKLEFGFSLLGGLHHARRSKASGFCYYNDINATIHLLKDMKPSINILYVDTDLHHGDGVQIDFYNDPNVTTISLHESGEYLFPGTGFVDEIGTGGAVGTKINLPLFPFTADMEYRNYFSELFDPIVESVQPDFIIWQAGSDARIDDPLGHLMLTSSTYQFLGEHIRKAANSIMDQPKVLGLGGGGYNPYGNAKSWVHSVSGLMDLQLPKSGSKGWVEQCLAKGIHVKIELDEEITESPEVDQKKIKEENINTFSRLKKILSPYYNFE